MANTWQLQSKWWLFDKRGPKLHRWVECWQIWRQRMIPDVWGDCVGDSWKQVEADILEPRQSIPNSSRQCPNPPFVSRSETTKWISCHYSCSIHVCGQSCRRVWLRATCQSLIDGCHVAYYSWISHHWRKWKTKCGRPDPRAIGSLVGSKYKEPIPFESRRTVAMLMDHLYQHVNKVKIKGQGAQPRLVISLLVVSHPALSLAVG